MKTISLFAFDFNNLELVIYLLNTATNIGAAEMVIAVSVQVLEISFNTFGNI